MEIRTSTLRHLLRQARAVAFYTFTSSFSVLGSHYGLGAQPDAVALPPDGKLNLRRSIGGQRIQAQLADDFHGVGEGTRQGDSVYKHAVSLPGVTMRSEATPVATGSRPG
jgi:hypothetical protein